MFSGLFSIEQIRKSCPVLEGLASEKIEKLTPTKIIDPDLSNVVFANCLVSVEQKLKYPAKCGFGCRNNTDLSSTGCPLRNGSIRVEMGVISS